MGTGVGFMTEPYVLDSNIIIYYLNDVLNELAKQRFKNLVKTGNAHISIITRIEVLGCHHLTEKSLKNTERLLCKIHQHSLNEEIVNSSIQLRQTFPIKVPDAIIAATALYLEMPLMTRNIKDFQKVPALKWFNPFEPNE
jgi:predicted nucleic acid-binding protein